MTDSDSNQIDRLKARTIETLDRISEKVEAITDQVAIITENQTRFDIQLDRIGDLTERNARAIERLATTSSETINRLTGWVERVLERNSMNDASD